MQNEAIEPGKDKDNLVAKKVFKPSSWLSKIDYINHLVLLNNVMIAVLAERSAGKTTFIDLLQSNLDSQIKSYVMKAAAPFSQADLLTQLDAVFHFSGDTEVSLANLVGQINERKAHVLVIIDDAQHLPDSFLQEALFELKNQGDNGFFHLCLVSDFSLVASLNKLETNLLHTLEPGVLTESETKTYLLNSLPSPKRLDKTMTDKRLEQFYQLTSGNIARINSQMVDYFCPEPLKPAEKRKFFVRNMSFMAAAAIALLASSYIWQNQFLPSSAKLSGEQDQTVAEIRQPLPSLIPLIPATENEAVLVSQLPDINHELANQPSQVPGWLVATVRQPAQPSPKRVVDIVLDEENDDSLVVRDRVVVIPKTLHTQAPVKTAHIASSQGTSSKVGQANFVKKQFTIQLLASRRLEDIKRFVNTHRITEGLKKEGLKIRLTKRDDLDWYVLTIGEYRHLEQAQTVIKNLPLDLARYNPWIRPVGQLKVLS